LLRKGVTSSKTLLRLGALEFLRKGLQARVAPKKPKVLKVWLEPKVPKGGRNPRYSRRGWCPRCDRVKPVGGCVPPTGVVDYYDWRRTYVESDATSPWASPVLMIRKPNGGIRFCIDYRRLNAVTVNDCYPMPLIDDILDVLRGANLFSTMDIASGYWNVPMAEDSIEKTPFTCKYGLFEWLVMPIGLCNAVPAFDRLMENVLVDLKWRTCLVYPDDCVVFRTDFPTHLVRLKQVLERFRAAGFKLKMKKCRWGRDQVAFLGHIVTPSGILPNPEKVKAVMKVARPHDLHTVQAFLGLTSYFRRYIPGYAAISAPIERLKVKRAEFVWNDDCEAAFRQLKRRLVEPVSRLLQEVQTLRGFLKDRRGRVPHAVGGRS